jgi:hypothetical protein
MAISTKSILNARRSTGRSPLKLMLIGMSALFLITLSNLGAGAGLRPRDAGGPWANSRPIADGKSPHEPSYEKGQAIGTAGRLKFELYNNAIYLPVRVNGSEPLTFLLDTGATESFITQPRARALGLSVTHPTEGSFGTGEDDTKLSFTRGLRFEVSGGTGMTAIPVVPKEVAVLSMDLGSIVGHVVDGIAGAEFFKPYAVEIDYAEREITFHEASSYAYNGTGQIVPLTLSNSRPYVRGTINVSGIGRMEGKFILDLGDTRALSLNAPYVKKHEILSPGRKTIRNVAHGIGGGAPELLGRVESLELGGFKLEQPVVAFSTAVKGSSATSSYDGVIGTEIFRRFRVIFDYSRRQLILEPTKMLATPFEADMIGVRWIATGADFKTVRVESVEEDSPAAEAGLLAGDSIEAIDGRPAAQLALDEIKQMFKIDSKDYSVRIRRGEQTLTVRVKTRRRI